MEERLANLEFYMELLLKQMDRSKYPWDYLIMRGKLSRREVQALYQLCEDLSKEMEKQKAEGFVTFSPLLIQFRQALPPDLLLEETIAALRTQGHYVPLMDAFQKLIKKK
ncbi:YhaI family protein [Sutcliffiella horikoshii]